MHAGFRMFFLYFVLIVFILERQELICTCITTQGPLSSTFPIENRITPVTLGALKTHLDRAKSLPYVKRIADFHLMLLLARILDVNADIPALAACVHTQSAIPEGYQLLIESMANAS